MTKQKKRHTPEQVIRKLREADAMLLANKIPPNSFCKSA